jgi:hypothetical protein
VLLWAPLPGFIASKHPNHKNTWCVACKLLKLVRNLTDIWATQKPVGSQRYIALSIGVPARANRRREQVEGEIER